MAIKTRLILAMAALLCVATVIIGTTATTAVVQSMTSNIDTQLMTSMREAARVNSYSDFRKSTTPHDSVAYQQLALMLVTDEGRVLQSQPAGFAGDREPLPAIPDPLPEPGKATTLSAVSGSTQYRVLVSDSKTMSSEFESQIDSPTHLIIAAPLTDVHDVQNNLVATMVVTAAIVLAAGVVAAFWITRRGMQPVTNMIDAAAAVADGDLDRRLPEHTRRSEIGRLSTALNIMVSKLVEAITERDLQQARLRRFIADASHELRTPLAAIRGYAELCESGEVPPGPAFDRAVGRIRSESDRMTDLVDDLLLLARLDQDTGRNENRLDLRQLAHDAVDDLRATDIRHTLSVYANEPVIVNADEARIRQVIVNLLTNATTHTPDTSHVTITVHQHRNNAVLTVEDNGPGIPMAHRDRVFDRFYRADDSRSRETGGTGLGLAIVKSIVEAHGGTVELDTQLGKGTAVSVTLTAIS